MSQSLHQLDPAARAALDLFFRGFGFESEPDLARLAEWAAAGAVGSQDELLAQAHARMESWLMQVLGPAAEGGSVLTRGRAAFVLSGAASHGAALVTGPAEQLPPSLLRTLRAAVPVATPAPLPGAMPEQQLVLNPFVELLRRCWRASEPDLSISR
jgi:hypothetical protein